MSNGNTSAGDGARVVYAPGAAPGLPFWKNLVAGGGAGAIEILIMYPLDVVKTRSQLAEGKTQRMFPAMASIVRDEGFARLYRGLASPLLAEAPKRAAKFTFNEQYKALLGPDRYVIAGALAGASEAVVNCPFEVVKVRMQAREYVGKYTSTLDAASAALRDEGLVRGLYRGFAPMAIRNAVWNGAYFGVIGWMRAAFPTRPDQSPAERKLHSFVLGVIGGSAGTTLNTPLDVVKSRLQNQIAAARGSTFPTLYRIWQAEGFRACYKGYAARMLRLGPGGGIMLVAFDYIVDLLQ